MKPLVPAKPLVSILCLFVPALLLAAGCGGGSGGPTQNVTPTPQSTPIPQVTGTPQTTPFQTTTPQASATPQVTPGPTSTPTPRPTALPTSSAVLSNELICLIWVANNRSELVRIHPDGSGRTRVATLTGAYDLTVSPDKRRVAFAKEESNKEGTRNDQLWVINVDGTGERQVTNSPGHHFSPAWSPDGQKLAFLSNSSLRICAVAGGSETILSTLPGYRPVWTPDGREVWFDYIGTLPSKTYRVPLDGTAPSRVPLGQFTLNGSVDFSPDGQQVVFYGVPDSYGGAPFTDVGLYVANRDGSNLHFVTRTSQCLPHWGPDGRQIMFASSRVPGTTAVNSDGSNQRILFPEFASDWG